MYTPLWQPFTNTEILVDKCAASLTDFVYIPFKGQLECYTVKTTSCLEYKCTGKDMCKLAASRNGLYIVVCCKGILCL